MVVATFHWGVERARRPGRVAGDKRSTINVGMFHGGHNVNVVPNACVVEIDRRLLRSCPGCAGPGGTGQAGLTTT